jgi:uncharacterized membrane-anchored protein
MTDLLARPCDACGKPIGSAILVAVIIGFVVVILIFRKRQNATRKTQTPFPLF